MIDKAAKHLEAWQAWLAQMVREERAPAAHIAHSDDLLSYVKGKNPALYPPKQASMGEEDIFLVWDQGPYHMDVNVYPDGSWAWFYRNRHTEATDGEEHCAKGAYSAKFQWYITPVKVAVIGSRMYPNQVQVRDFIRTLSPCCTIVSGGAIGVDTWAEEEARSLGLPEPIVKKPQYAGKTYAQRKKAPLERNLEIVKLADKVVAFWDGTSPGTVNAIKHALKLHREIEVYAPDGSRWDLNRFEEKP